MKKTTCNTLLRHALLLTACVAGLVSCQKALQEVAPEGASEISFAAENASFVMEADTKASTGTSEVTALNTFRVAATTGAAGAEASVWNNVAFTQIGTSGNYTGGKTWPASNPNYNFYATNKTGDTPMTFTAGGATIAAANTQDIVCAYLPYGSVTYKAKNTLSFEHIFARVNTVTVEAESGYTVSGVTVSITPVTGGTYNLRTGKGKTDGTGWSGLTTGSLTTIANQVGANSNDIWLVPGRYTITASWTATQTGGSSVPYTSKTVDVDITGGKKNNITATLGGEMVFGVEVEAFADNEVPLTFGLHQSSSGERFNYAGGTGKLTLSGYAGTWSMEYSTDGGSTFSSTTPSNVTVTRTSSNQGVQEFDVVLAPASPSSTGVTLGTWPTDSRHNTVLGSAGSPVDLSILDVHGDVLPGGRTTANTYVVHAPGTYMIPLVYGNAITDGAANNKAYVAQVTGSGVVSNFKNAYDTNISSPYIETDVAANSHSLGGASLAWSDRSGLVSVKSALETHGGIKYLVFEVPAGSIGYGNAVVSVKDNSDNVVWSWLVWVTGNELWDDTVEARVSPATEQVSFLSEAIGNIYPTGTGNVYDAFDCVVKFKTTGGQELFYTIARSAARVYTTFNGSTTTVLYQFGRPTPQRGNNNTVAEGAFSISDGTQVSAATMLKNPTVFYKREASPYNWCSDNSSQFYNIWNNNQAGADQNKDIIKTVYDPCPAGYAMPKRNAFQYFTTNGNGYSASGDDVGNYVYFNVIDKNGDSSISAADFVRGWYMKAHATDNVGIYFPAAGYRDSSSGSVYYVGGYGYYWSSSPRSTDTGRSLYFRSTYLIPLSEYYRAHGFSVRPARIQ